jgi:hypothetical protein
MGPLVAPDGEPEIAPPDLALDGVLPPAYAGAGDSSNTGASTPATS